MKKEAQQENSVYVAKRAAADFSLSRRAARDANGPGCAQPNGSLRAESRAANHRAGAPGRKRVAIAPLCDLALSPARSAKRKETRMNRIVACVMSVWVVANVGAQEIRITSFNGSITWSNTVANTVYLDVEWASSLEGQWTNTWEHLTFITNKLLSGSAEGTHVIGANLRIANPMMTGVSMGHERCESTRRGMGISH